MPVTNLKKFLTEKKKIAHCAILVLFCNNVTNINCNDRDIFYGNRKVGKINQYVNIVAR